MKKVLLFLASVFICFYSFADVTVPPLFGNNMVLQRNKPIPIWGKANAHETIKVSFNHQVKSTKADKAGKWFVTLNNEAAGGPYQLVIQGKNTLTFSNVLVGEVWICSGQSNMEMPIEGWGKVNNYQQEIAEANYPMIRHFKVPRAMSTRPLDTIDSAEWQISSPATAGELTAAGYFFARALYQKLNVPVGLINTSWGGTIIETWISRPAFENSDDYKKMIAGMPSLDLDSLAKVNREAAVHRIEALQGPMTDQDTRAWKDAGTDDSKWPQMPLPNLWEQQQLGDLDGIVWFRKTVTVSKEDAGKPATLELAMIDDNDITYVNGVKTGSTNGYNIKRNYAIPAGILKEGSNVIAVRVEDTGGGGGIYGDSTAMQLTVDHHVLPLAGKWYFKVEKIDGNAASVGPNSYPTLLFNAMINPLVPFAIAGVIWYQGESNAGRAYQYRKAFPLMITDWRKRWKEGNFPFYFVQLASFNADKGTSASGSSWAELREAQARTLSLPHTGMAVITDIGDAADIHPKDKQDVGKRLAAIALHDVYGQDNAFSGPVYESMTTDGNKIITKFTSVGGGLLVKDKYGYLKGFEIAGADKKFHYAKAMVDGNTVIVYADSVSKPVAVRYGWADYAGDDNLYNKEGFPAAPFRSDDWTGITDSVIYEIGR